MKWNGGKHNFSYWQQLSGWYIPGRSDARQAEENIKIDQAITPANKMVGTPQTYNAKILNAIKFIKGLDQVRLIIGQPLLSRVQ